MLLTFHIGKGRSASTLLQKCLRIMHGKNGLYFVGKPFDNILSGLHDKIIRSNQNQYSIKGKGEALKNYCNYICGIIRKNKKSNHFIISDENIADEINYTVKKNLINLKIIISLIKKELKGHRLNVNLLKDKNGLKKYVCETFKINKINNSTIRKFYKLGIINESKNLNKLFFYKLTPYFLKKFFRFISSENTRVKIKRSFEANLIFDETIKKNIQNKYKKSNIKLKNLKCLRGYDLKKYGYINF